MEAPDSLPAVLTRWREAATRLRSGVARPDRSRRRLRARSEPVVALLPAGPTGTDLHPALTQPRSPRTEPGLGLSARLASEIVDLTALHAAATLTLPSSHWS